MRSTRRFAALVGCATLVAGAGLAGATTTPDGNTDAASGDQHLVCVAPTDARAIDGVLESAGSPLAGEGMAFVNYAAAAGLDPRALVAIAEHETVLATYAPAHRIRNPFGLGPHWEFPSYERAIATAAQVLRDGYLAEGRTTIAAISPKWAPVGAANDPTGLNQHWTSGVGGYYAALGGDPAEPILLDTQDPTSCGGAVTDPDPEARDAPGAEPEPPGPLVVVAWGGARPQATGRGPWDGADPSTGDPATIAGFVFPLAAPQNAPIHYADDYRAAGAPGCHDQPWRCAVDLDTAEGRAVVASLAGTLRVATATEREAGIGFWIESGRDRFGYAPLAAYAPGLAGGSAVSVGQWLGQHTGPLRVAWTRDGTPVNPFPLLDATRPAAARPEESA